MALIDRLMPLHAEGLTMMEAAERLGITYHCVRKLASDHNLKFRRPKSSGPVLDAQRQLAAERSAEMAEMYRAGLTLQQIGDCYDISRERVRQLLRAHTNVTKNDGGQSKRVEAARAQRFAKMARQRDYRCLRSVGCSWEERRKIEREAEARRPGSGKSMIRAYWRQRGNARARGIAWEFTLVTWWSVWRASGHWGARGRGQGYVMCRKGDTGPYAPGNVFIAPAVINTATQRKFRKRPLPIGVYSADSGRYRASRVINGKKLYLGTFDTPEEAHAAYLVAGPALPELKVPASSRPLSFAGASLKSALIDPAIVG